MDIEKLIDKHIGAGITPNLRKNCREMLGEVVAELWTSEKENGMTEKKAKEIIKKNEWALECAKKQWACVIPNPILVAEARGFLEGVKWPGNRIGKPSREFKINGGGEMFKKFMIWLECKLSGHNPISKQINKEDSHGTHKWCSVCLKTIHCIDSKLSPKDLKWLLEKK